MNVLFMGIILKAAINLCAIKFKKYLAIYDSKPMGVLNRSFLTQTIRTIEQFASKLGYFELFITIERQLIVTTTRGRNTSHEFISREV